MSFENQSFVIVGGGKVESIGLEFVKQLLCNGAEKVAVFDKSDPDTIIELKSMFSNKHILFYKVDVQNKREIEMAFNEVINEFGHVDVLANFAAIVDETNPEDVIGINLLGVIHGTMVGMDHMSIVKGGKGGTIMNMASICGLDSFSWAPIYCASKHGVVGFTKSLADEEMASKHGIKYVMICPSFTQNSILASLKSQIYELDAAKRDVTKYGVQTSQQCAKNIMEIMKKSENGTAWLVSNAEHKQVNFHSYYKTN